MKIDSMYELCEAVCDFHDMMLHDKLWMKDSFERTSKPADYAKFKLLTNLLEDFGDLVEFAKQYCEQNDETL